MKILYFDCYSGAAGDMILGSLLDLGLEQNTWLKSIRGLSVSGFEVKFDRVVRHGIAAQKVNVHITEEQPHRHLKDLKKIIGNSVFPDAVKQNVIRIFTRLAEAEAHVHDTTIDKIHFHEVGAVDAIVDILGTCLAIDTLGVDKIYCSPVGLGRGVSKCEHGPMPLPPPATLEILKGCPVHMHEVDTELCTPTGAAILSSLASFTPPPEIYLLKVGYGAGAKDIDTLPNVVRALLLEERREFEADQALLLETNIDDMNPELYPHVLNKMLTGGAMDAYLNPIIMKKGRPGIVLSVLCAPEFKSGMIDLIYRETTTLGIRISAVERLKLPREEIEVEIPWGKIRGKKAIWNGKTRITPEYEDCRRLSEEKDIPLQEIYRAFNAAVEKLCGDKSQP